MGPTISANYDQINEIFTIGPWKVHSAVHRTSKERVSLWIADQELINTITADKGQQEKYLLRCLVGVQQARKLRHPHILKISEIQDSNVWQLAFIAEPVSSNVTTLVGSLDKIDSAYISYQIADVLGFLHNKSLITHFGLSPDAIFLNEVLDVKLFKFDWCAPILAEGRVELPFTTYLGDILQPIINYSSPEVVICKQCTPAADVFSFACLIYQLLTSKQLLNYSRPAEYDTSRSPATLMTGIDPIFYNLLTDCLNPTERMRPKIEQILEHEAFQTVHMKTLKYLDLIIAKDPKDKFGFFKGLSKALTQFSPMLVRVKILPILIEECKYDVRFAPILLGLIFTASERMSVSEFTELVFKKISFLVNVIEPPEVLIALIQGIPLILEKTENSLHNDCVYPIIYQALSANSAAIQKEILKKLPIIVEKLSEQSVRTALLPRLVELAYQTKEAQIVASALGCLPICLKKADNELFVKELFPKLFSAWKKHQDPVVAKAMLSIFENLQATPKTMLSRGVPVAADIAGNTSTSLWVQKKLVEWIQNVLTNYRNVNHLDQVTQPDDDTPPTMQQVTPVKPKPVQKTPVDFSFSSPSPTQNFDQPLDFTKPSPAATIQPHSSADMQFGSAFPSSPPPSGPNLFATSPPVQEPSRRPQRKTDGVLTIPSHSKQNDDLFDLF